MTSSKRKFLVALLIVVVVAGIGYAMLSSRRSAGPEKKVEAASKPALTVNVIRPTEKSLPLQLIANGDIAAWQEASIGSELNGLRLAEVRVNVGDTVQAGQVLARFAPETVEADVMAAKASLMEAQATAVEAANNAARARTLQKTGALSEQQINQYLTGEKTARARVEAAKAQLAVQQLRQRHLQVVAPDSGVISARMATVGAVPGAGTELFRMIRQGRLEWRARVTAAEIGRVKSGTAVTITAASGAQVGGKVRMVAPTVDAQTREGLVYVDLAQTAERNSPVKAGMFARGWFLLGESPALTVPQEAIVLRDGFSYVYAVTPERRVRQLKVRTGRRADDQVEILEGMPRDAQIVASGAGFLNDGDLVRISQDGAPVAKEARQ